MFGFLKKTDISDEEAMEKFQKGNHKCFDLLVDRHSKGLYRFIFRMIGGNIANAEDLLQEVFIKLIENRDSYDSNRKFTTWIYRLARNHTIDFIRKEKYRNHSSLDRKVAYDSGSNITYLDLVRTEEKDQEQKLIESSISNQIYKKLDGLKEEFKEVFILREIEGLKFDEIAQITDININTVKSRHRYAFKELRNELLNTDFFKELNNADEVSGL